MKGQLSIEYLLVSTVAILLILVSLAALIGVKDYSDSAMKVHTLKSSAISLNTAINEVCALGNGNGRVIQLTTNLSIDCEYADEEWVVSFYDPENSIIHSSHCEVKTAKNLNGLVYIQNEKGIIKITER